MNHQRKAIPINIEANLKISQVSLSEGSLRFFKQRKLMYPPKRTTGIIVTHLTWSKRLTATAAAELIMPDAVITVMRDLCKLNQTYTFD